ncbi:helix-turn-helix domain-containing protein [Legionella sp. km772]|uniref:helix-turn-helix domain-containing protein n=1 Tax=Legionella sp. km772 TaxID=2498111 RepID=UPI000F8EFD8D|nr:helix-turn-helix domain-containing protein [Legionella sp. km772]RUR10431.1 ArsR family transcriptional regulator [Legionella sp. km772]
MNDNAKLVLHPIRLRLLRALVNRKLSIAQLLDELADVPIATAYRHINKLLDADLIYVCEERLVRGTVERIFALPQKNLIAFELLAEASKEEHFNYFSTFVATLLDDYQRYLESGTVDLPRDGVGYRSLQLYLSDEELAAMARDLHLAMSPYLELKPKRGRIARVFSTVLVPKKSESRRKNECAS